MESNLIEEHNYIKAKKRVEKIKGFYIHLAIYVIINLFLSGIILYGLHDEGSSYADAFSNFGLYSVWVFWGIGMFFHWLGVFGFQSFFGSAWEEKKLHEIMDKENKNQL